MPGARSETDSRLKCYVLYHVVGDLSEDIHHEAASREISQEVVSSDEQEYFNTNPNAYILSYEDCVTLRDIIDSFPLGKDYQFSFKVSPTNEYVDLIDLDSKVPLWYSQIVMLVVFV